MLDPASLQRMLYDTLDRSDDIVLVLEQTGHEAADLCVASANDAFCRVSGHRHDDLIGQRFAALVAPEVDQSSWSQIIGAAAKDGSCNAEILCSRKDGAVFRLGLHLMLVRNATPRHFVVLGRDITASFQARQQQAAVQGLLAKVFLCVKAPVAIVAENGLIQMTNPALDQLLGYPPGGLGGKLAIDCIAPGDRPAAVAARQRQVEDGHDYTLAARLLHADGTELPVDLTSITVQRDDLRRFRIVTVLPRPDDAAATVRVAGKIKLIGLDEVKHALGSRWGAVAARAMASAEHVIRRRCAPCDTLSRTSDGGFLICFAGATEDEASFRAAALAREIRTRLVGDGETETTATVSAVAAAVDVPNAARLTTDTLAAAINERLNARLAQIEERARQTLRDALRSTTCRLEPVRSRHTRDVVAHFARLPAELENRILAAYSTLPLNERQEFDFDRLVLGVAADQAITELAEGGSVLILVNVDFDVFLDRRRTERYMAACQALDIRLRERLVLVLSGLPNGLPSSRLIECVMRLRPFCHGVGFQSGNMQAPPVEFSLLGAAIVVLREDGRAMLTSKDLEALGRLIDSVHACRARVLVRGVPSWEATRPLARPGVDLVSIAGEERTC
jgi:PAS domain S-box-containing protein